MCASNIAAGAIRCRFGGSLRTLTSREVCATRRAAAGPASARLVSAFFRRLCFFFSQQLEQSLTLAFIRLFRQLLAKVLQILPMYETFHSGLPARAADGHP